MSEQTIRRSVPPRELAATITARAVLRAGWAVATVYLAISAVVLVEHWIVGASPTGILVPLVAILVMSSVLLVLALRPNWMTGVLFLGVGGLAAFAYVYGLLSAEPTLNTDGTYLLNRPAIVLLLVGAVSSRLVDGVLWCTTGWVVGTIATAAAQGALGLDIRPGYGPVVSLAIYLTIIVMFALIRRSQRRFAPDFTGVEVETARMAGRRELEERAVALIHDTVLGDLVALANGRENLDERTRARFLSDIATVTSARLEPRVTENPGDNDTDGALRQELLAVISDFRWRGLTVDVSGGEFMSASLAPEAAEALVGAVRGCLENVVRHAGAANAELFLDRSEQSLSVMIVDHGIGFDPEDIPANRLGIRRSLVQRIEGNGGTVRIWSAAGVGTSVVITLPLEVRDD